MMFKHLIYHFEIKTKITTVLSTLLSKTNYVVPIGVCHQLIGDDVIEQRLNRLTD